MKKVSIIVIFFLYPILSYAQLADHIVIAEVYGGGGNAGSYWTHDYIILYNPTGSNVDVSTWSVQYASSSGSTWQVTNLIGSIGSGHYYAIQEAQGSGGVAPLPFTPNVIGSIPMSASSGKVALLNTQTALTISDPNGSPSLIDFLGYGSANAYEGAGAAPTLNNTSSARRKDNNGNNTYGNNGSGWDTNNNSSDFYLETDIINNVPLPVELSSFSAIVLENSVKLNWRTETEVSNYGFEILRAHTSTPLSVTEWDALGFVQGHGNSNSPKEYSFTDDLNLNAALNHTLSYRLKQIDTDGKFEYSKVIQVDLGSPAKYELSQNYPNPFNPVTTIRFTLTQPGNVRLILYNTLGEQAAELVNEFKDAGVHTINFNASELNSGVYIYKLESNGFAQARKMTLVK
jgi:hypothetical protein